MNFNCSPFLFFSSSSSSNSKVLSIVGSNFLLGNYKVLLKQMACFCLLPSFLCCVYTRRLSVPFAVYDDGSKTLTQPDSSRQAGGGRE